VTSSWFSPACKRTLQKKSPAWYQAGLFLSWYFNGNFELQRCEVPEA
jgi:hypothetical protein